MNMTSRLCFGVRSLPTMEDIPSLCKRLQQIFAHAESRAYMDSICGLAEHPGRPEIVAARIGALSLLVDLAVQARANGMNIPPAETWILRRDEHGRPYTSVSDFPFDFNVSHSNAHVACAILTGKGRVGIDVEEPIPEARAARLWARYATEHEQTHLPTKQDFSDAFTRIWTVREAMAKQDGRGMPLRFDATSCPPHLRVICGTLSDTGASLSLCFPADVGDKVLPPLIGHINWNEFKNPPVG